MCHQKHRLLNRSINFFIIQNTDPLSEQIKGKPTPIDFKQKDLTSLKFTMTENQDLIITHSYVKDKVDHLMSSTCTVRRIYETKQKESCNTLTNESKSNMLEIMTKHDKMQNEALKLNKIFIDKFNTKEFLKLHGLSNISQPAYQ